MTIRAKVENLSWKQCSLMMRILAYEAFHCGVNLPSYLAMVYLYDLITKAYKLPEEIYEEKVRQALLLVETILANFSGEWLSLTDLVDLPQETLEIMNSSGWLPSPRTYSSWKHYHSPENLLEVRVVPVDDLIERRENFSERYSSYTKGYGNGGHVSRTKKTRYSAELDGEETDREPPEFNLMELDIYQNLVLSIERAKARRTQQK